MLGFFVNNNSPTNLWGYFFVGKEINGTQFVKQYIFSATK